MINLVLFRLFKKILRHSSYEIANPKYLGVQSILLFIFKFIKTQTNAFVLGLFDKIYERRIIFCIKNNKIFFNLFMLYNILNLILLA